MKHKDDMKTGPIALFHMRLDFSTNGPRKFKRFNLQFVLPPHTSTTEELHDVK